MPYTILPNSGQSLGVTRNPIRENFRLIQSAFDQNHGDGTGNGLSQDNGKHKFVQMPEQIASPLPVTAGNEIAIYSRQGVNPSETNLFLRAEGNGFEYQLTHVVSASITVFGKNVVDYAAPGNPDNNGGWTFIAGDPTVGGLILQYGRKTSANIASGTITFPLVFPSGNAPFSIVATWERAAGTVSPGIKITSSSSTNFTYNTQDTGLTGVVNWMVIGN